MSQSHWQHIGRVVFKLNLGKISELAQNTTGSFPTKLVGRKMEIMCNLGLRDTSKIYLTF